MLAERASSINSRLPENIRDKAQLFGDELAWTASDAKVAVLWLASDGCAVVGVELWRERDGHPLWIATSDYSPSPYDAITSEKVAWCARKADEFIQTHCWESGALFNLTWLEPVRLETREPVVAKSALT